MFTICIFLGYHHRLLHRHKRALARTFMDCEKDRLNGISVRLRLLRIERRPALEGLVEDKINTFICRRCAGIGKRSFQGTNPVMERKLFPRSHLGPPPGSGDYTFPKPRHATRVAEARCRKFCAGQSFPINFALRY